MTIIQPNKPKSKLRFFILPLILMLFAGVYLSIVFYSDVTEFKVLLSKKEKELQELEVLSAELKNQLYNILDTQNMAKAAEEAGLILEQNPIYLKPVKGELVSQL